MELQTQTMPVPHHRAIRREPVVFGQALLTTAFHAAGVSSFQMGLVHHDESLGMSTFHLAF
jgi:hypothetical protein